MPLRKESKTTAPEDAGIGAEDAAIPEEIQEPAAHQGGNRPCLTKIGAASGWRSEHVGFSTKNVLYPHCRPGEYFSRVSWPLKPCTGRTTPCISGETMRFDVSVILTVGCMILAEAGSGKQGYCATPKVNGLHSQQPEDTSRPRKNRCPEGKPKLILVRPFRYDDRFFRCCRLQ